MTWKLDISTTNHPPKHAWWIGALWRSPHALGASKRNVRCGLLPWGLPSGDPSQILTLPAVSPDTVAKRPSLLISVCCCVVVAAAYTNRGGRPGLPDGGFKDTIYHTKIRTKIQIYGDRPHLIFYVHYLQFAYRLISVKRLQWLYSKL